MGDLSGEIPQDRHPQSSGGRRRARGRAPL
jgi:hypothetical protein